MRFLPDAVRLRTAPIPTDEPTPTPQPTPEPVSPTYTLRTERFYQPSHLTH